MASAYFKDEIQKGVQNNNLNSITAKLSKYIDQIILSILRMAPNELLDQYFFTIIKRINIVTNKTTS